MPQSYRIFLQREMRHMQRDGGLVKLVSHNIFLCSGLFPAAMQDIFCCFLVLCTHLLELSYVDPITDIIPDIHIDFYFEVNAV